MSRHEVTLIPGDGVGPVLVEATREVIAATGVGIAWDERLAGKAAERRHGTPLPQEVLDSVRANGVAIKGPLASHASLGSLNRILRLELDLFASVRPCRALAPDRQVDLVIVRETHEDVFAGREFSGNGDGGEEPAALGWRPPAGEYAVATRPISAAATRRVARIAVELSASRRGLLTIGHKADAMPAADGLFRRVVAEVAREHGGVEVEDGRFDTLCGRLVARPDRFDVIVLPNLFGDIASDIGAALAGGTSVAPAVNVGPTGFMVEAVHGSADRLEHSGRANPTALFLAAAEMLTRLGETAAADAIAAAIARAYRRRRLPDDQLPDRRGGLSTREFTREVVTGVMQRRARARATVTCVGQGQMGRLVASRLEQAGHRVRRVDPGLARSEEAGPRVSELPGPLGAVLLNVPGPSEARTVVRELSGLDPAVRPTHVVNLSTVGPAVAQELADLVAAELPGTVYLEAPVTGGVTHAREGRLVFLAGCASREDLAELEDVLEPLAADVQLFASPRHAAAAKLANNIAAMGNALTAIEAMSFGRAHGLDPRSVLRVLRAGTANSYTLHNSVARLIEHGDYRTGFAARLALKDLRLAMTDTAGGDEALPITSHLADELGRVVDAGHGDLSFAAAAIVRGLVHPPEPQGAAQT